jgi:putative transposase
MTTRKRHNPEQVVRMLVSADRMLGEGKDIADVCRELGVSEQTYHRWRNQFGGLKADDAKRLKDLERENSTLKRLLADAELEKAALKEIAKRTSKPGTPAGGGAPPHRRDGCVGAARVPGYRAEPHHPAPYADRSDPGGSRCWVTKLASAVRERPSTTWVSSRVPRRARRGLVGEP